MPSSVISARIIYVKFDGRLAFFDFGMVGRITPQLQSKMIDAFFHVVAKDPAGIAQDLIDLDFMKPGSDAEMVKPVVEKMFEFHLNLKLKEVNFKELTYDLPSLSRPKSLSVNILRKSLPSRLNINSLA